MSLELEASKQPVAKVPFHIAPIAQNLAIEIAEPQVNRSGISLGLMRPHVTYKNWVLAWFRA